jgi:3'(2'), 5'-bisphosphate nucleotidase
MMISQSERRRMLAVFEELALKAGQEIMAVRAKRFDVAEKADGSPVTEADQRAESVIVSGLLKHFPDIPVVAEEMTCGGGAPKDLGGVFFLVDALDGTKEFCAGRDEFTVNIALVRQSVPVLGVIYSPATHVLYAGEHDGTGQGSAFKRKIPLNGSVEEAISINARVISTPQTVLATRSHMTPETRSFLDGCKGADLRSIGSSLKFCLLAAGEADTYPRFGTTMEWDTAAGDAILRAAGGRTETLDGEPLTYGKRGQAGMADFQNPFFVSRGG